MKPHSTQPPFWLVAIVLAIAIAAVYGRALDAPFLMDDTISIVDNPSITRLWPLIGTAENRGPLNPEPDLPTSGRPIVNFSFALNYKFGGLSPTGYHVVNAVIHFASALLLWAVVRRTLLSPRFAGRFATDAGWLALATSLLWALHPLQTEALIYSTQRTELLMAFFYLATVYCSIRYWLLFPLPPGEGRGEGVSRIGPQPRVPSPKPGATLWPFLAVIACCCGMASKEVMVSAPVIVLLYDRTFVSGGFAEALRRSSKLYVGLFASWILLLALNAGAPRSGSAGFHFDVPVYVWWLTQCKVILLYLKLVVWPAPLLVQYQRPYVTSAGDAWVYVVPILLLAILALELLRRNNPVGFLLTFIAAILAPTSVVPILTEMAAERRMYLPLAALSTLFVVGIYLLARRMFEDSPANTNSTNSNTPRIGVLAVTASLAIAFAIASATRLTDYYDELQLWRQVAESEPQNFMAHYNLGLIYNEVGREPESLAELQASVVANPNYPNSRSALGFALINAGRLPEALESIQAALAIRSDYVPALNNLGIVLTRMGRPEEAIAPLQAALHLNPNHAPAHNNLGKAFLAVGQTPDAVKELSAAATLAPQDPDMLVDLATAVASAGQLPDAIALLNRALELRPNSAAAHNAIGIAYFQSGNVAQATHHFEQLLKLKPHDAGAHINLGNIFASQGDLPHALPLFQKAAELQPDFAEAHLSVAMAQDQLGKRDEAIESYQTAIKLKPGLLPAYLNLAEALSKAKREAEAVEIAKRGLEAARTANDSAVTAQLERWIKLHSSNK
jgi:tetratricopeptide (TPR) repeat protein